MLLLMRFNTREQRGILDRDRKCRKDKKKAKALPVRCASVRSCVCRLDLEVPVDSLSLRKPMEFGIGHRLSNERVNPALPMDDELLQSPVSHDVPGFPNEPKAHPICEGAPVTQLVP